MGGHPSAGVLDPDLEGGGYQAAPITSLALARWTWAVVAMLLGGVLGYLAVNGVGGYRGTATIQLRAAAAAQGMDQTQISPQGIVALSASDDVLDRAVRLLRTDLAADYARDGGRLPAPRGTDESAARDYLGDALTAVQPTGAADLVELSVTRTAGSAGAPAYEANAIALAVKSKITADSDARIEELRKEFDARARGLTGAQLTTLQNDFQAQVDRIAFGDKQAVNVIRAKRAYWAGSDPNTAALLGAAGGTLLGALVAVGVGAGRRRPRSPRELVSLAPDLVARTPAQAGELAGRLLETGRRAAVVLALPRAAFPAAQFGMAVAHHVRTHGATVAFVDRLSDGADRVAADERLWALRRDVRLDVQSHFAADIVVVACPADEEALSLIAGQSDLLVVVVGKRRGSTLGKIRRTVDAVRVAEPVVVLA